jgi:TonB family protein
MKKTRILLLLVLPILEMSLPAQSYSSSRENAQQIPDSCKPVIPEDTTFYPETNRDPGAWVEYEEMPVFPGGDMALREFVKKKTIYPEAALKDSLTGRVIVRFAVGTGGCPTDISILRGIREDLDNECIRVIKLMPKFKPGKILRNSPKGWYWTTTNVWYMVPFYFRLRKDETDLGIVILPG